MKNHAAKYIERYAEMDTEVECPLPRNAASIAVLVPVYNEPPSFLERLKDLLSFHGILVCVIINHTENSTPAVKAANREILARIHDSFTVSWTNLNHGVSFAPSDSGWLCVVDRCSNGRELHHEKGGVGVARKLAADLILRWSSAIRCPWIVSTDSDANIPHSLLKSLEATATSASAIALPFRHLPSGDDEVDEATRLYEVHLRLYRAGLERAGSPYAFDTLGSSLAVHRDAYSKARGFPRREGGEDFYLLNKLAKLGGVARLTGEPVRILSRHSQRAPFGTGPAVATIVENGLDAFRTYDPQQFVVLRTLLESVHLGVSRGGALGDAFMESAEEALIEANVLAAAQEQLAVIGLQDRVADAIARTTSQASALRRFHDYFDGLRTLQWIHGMQPSLPNVAWREALPESMQSHDLTSTECCDRLFEQTLHRETRALLGTAYRSRPPARG